MFGIIKLKMDREILKKIFLQVFPEIEENFSLNKPQAEFENWDSLAHLHLISEIENVFNVC